MCSRAAGVTNKLSQNLSGRPWTPPLRCVRAGWLPFPPPLRRSTDKTSFSFTTVPLRRFYWVPDSIQQQKQTLTWGDFYRGLKTGRSWSRQDSCFYVFPCIGYGFCFSWEEDSCCQVSFFRNFLERQSGSKPQYVFEKNGAQAKVLDLKKWPKRRSMIKYVWACFVSPTCNLNPLSSM